MYYLKYFTGNIFIILETFFNILEVLLLYRKRNDLDTGTKKSFYQKKNYSTWHLICRQSEMNTNFVMVLQGEQE
jgi:hypothetical protein